MFDNPCRQAARDGAIKGGELTLKQVFGSQVQVLRKRQRWTQAKLAEKVGLSLEMIGMLERGRAAPSLATIEKLSSVLGVPAPVLLGGAQAGTTAHLGGNEIIERIFQMLSTARDEDLDGIERVIVALLGSGSSAFKKEAQVSSVNTVTA
jgi:XRE family transcriptional regulator, regulator of sulfur utilization